MLEERDVDVRLAVLQGAVEHAIQLIHGDVFPAPPPCRAAADVLRTALDASREES